MRALALSIALAGCYQPALPRGVPCAGNGECPSGLVCDTSRALPICVDRIPALEPDAGAADAAPPPDAPPDAMIPPAFAAVASARGDAVASLTYSLTIPPGAGRFLLVSVQLGSNCTAAVPAVTGVTYSGLALTRITTIVGTPCGMLTTRSDQWQLVAPPDGAHDVVVTLAGTANTVHSGALAFTGIDQTTPVRASAIARGDGTQSSVDVASQSGDLIVNTVGQGGGIVASGAGQTERFKRNASGDNTLDNSAASTAAAAGTTTTMTWAFTVTDEWQTISSALKPL
ncbi:MAG TPA: hypothetical protein VNO30_15865 [Kofleriaceae bacterium]|nr:hypothetical protein [Kofleriaceae bacterium]